MQHQDFHLVTLPASVNTGILNGYSEMIPLKVQGRNGHDPEPYVVVPIVGIVPVAIRRSH